MRQHRLRFFLILLPIFLSVICHGQDYEVKFRHYTIDSLSEKYSVNSVFQDSLGFIWLGTNNGLYQFDGYFFKQFIHQSGEKGSIPGDTVHVIYELKNGTMLAGTNAGLVSYDKKTGLFSFFLKSDLTRNSINRTVVHNILEDSHGNLWIGTNSGLLKYDTTSQKAETFYLSEDTTIKEKITCLSGASDGAIWVGSKKGAYRIRPGGESVSSLERETENNENRAFFSVLSIFEDNKGRIWAGLKNNGLWLFSEESEVFEKVNLGEKGTFDGNLSNILTISSDNSGNLILGIKGKLCFYNHRTGHLSLNCHTILDSVSQDNIRVKSILKDRQDGFWIGMKNAGLHYFHPGQYQFSHMKETFLQANMDSFCVNDIVVQEQFHILATQKGLILYDTLKHSTALFNVPFDGNKKTDNQQFSSVNCLCLAENNNIWLGSDGYLSMFNYKTRQIKHFELTGESKKHKKDESLAETENLIKITAITPDKNGHVWVGTDSSGLFRFNLSDNNFDLHVEERTTGGVGLPHISVVSLLYDSESDLWIGTKNGIARYDTKKEQFYPDMIAKNQDISPLNSPINCIYEDMNLNIWIGTEKRGLFLLQDKHKGKFLRYSVADGMPGNTVMAILSDKKGRIWASSQHGITRLDPVTERIVNFSPTDGLQDDVFIRNSAFSSDGKLYFGGINGYNAFSPAQIEPNTFLPPVYITRFVVDGIPLHTLHSDKHKKNINLAETIRLSPNKNSIKIGFSALNYLAPHENQYQYTLAGYDSNWKYCKGCKLVEYRNLEPGTYFFKVMASNNHNYWNEETASVFIIIDKYFWQTFVFRLLILLLLIVGVILVFHLLSRKKILSLKYQIERNEKKLEINTLEKEKQQIKYELAKSWQDQKQIQKDIIKLPGQTRESKDELNKRLDDQKSLYIKLEEKSKEIEYKTLIEEIKEYVHTIGQQKKQKSKQDIEFLRRKTKRLLRELENNIREKISIYFPEVSFTPEEIELLSYFKCKLSLSEISSFLLIDKRKILARRNRLKKKLNLSNKELKRLIDDL